MTELSSSGETLQIYADNTFLYGGQQECIIVQTTGTVQSLEVLLEFTGIDESWASDMFVTMQSQFSGDCVQVSNIYYYNLLSSYLA